METEGTKPKLELNMHPAIDPLSTSNVWTVGVSWALRQRFATIEQERGYECEIRPTVQGHDKIAG